jgi:multidrug efflux pump subunit AcrA (membrane-fusion protein)
MWKWLVVAVAVAGAVFGIVRAYKGVQPEPVPALVNTPLLNPKGRSIAGSGLVEPKSENIVIGVSDPGMVMQIFVKQHDRVKKGDRLFEIDSRVLQGQLLEARAAVQNVSADLARTVAYRRAEEGPSLRAKVAQAKALAGEATVGVAQAEAAVGEAEGSVAEAETNIKSEEVLVQDYVDQLERSIAAAKGNAMPEEQMVRTKFKLDEERVKLDSAKSALRTAQAKVKTTQAAVLSAKEKVKTAAAGIDAAQADLDLFLAGAWAADVEKAKAVVAAAQATVERLNGEIARRMVCAPIDGTVLRVNVHLGEYATAEAITADLDAPIVIGDIHPLHVRADIDEFDAQRFKPRYKAHATPKGTSLEIPLEFVRVDPFVIPKRALTNSQHELVDTRVLEIIYRIPDSATTLYVGQQVDVTIEEDAGPTSAQLDNPSTLKQ